MKQPGINLGRSNLYNATGQGIAGVGGGQHLVSHRTVCLRVVACWEHKQISELRTDDVKFLIE